ncbi:hypothetical protein AJ88_21930 [Mesorhizobium amorphae CCBAU 01583]|nr:hypothetical protein AJ88_21930 [Mesorhizobium amorphae CCBAU 01583]
MRTVYLDNNATTRVDPEVVQAMLPFFTDQFGNPSSTHGFGASVGAAVRKARQQLQALIGAEFDDEITFTSGGTESDNAAILSALEDMPNRTEIVTSAVEHPAVLALCAHLEKSAASRCTEFQWIAMAGSTSTPTGLPSPHMWQSSQSCGRTTRPVRSSPWPSLLSWPRKLAPFSIPMPCRRLASFRWT